MSRRLTTVSVKHLVLAVAGGLMMASASMAAEPIEEIVVVAPHEVVTKTEVGRSVIGAPIENISLTRRVSYRGLNLKKHADVLELERRVKEVSKMACDQLERLYPEALYPPTPSNQNCVKTAEKDAMAQVRAAVAAAEKR